MIIAAMEVSDMDRKNRVLKKHSVVDSTDMVLNW